MEFYIPKAKLWTFQTGQLFYSCTGEKDKTTSRNVTCGNYFTSVTVDHDLLKTRLAIVGTINKNKSEIPREFAITSTEIIVSYTPQDKKLVLLLSTLHVRDED
nr:unnamed protein product [Callosobruchus analis]